MLPRHWLAALPWILRSEAKFGSHRRACALDEQELVRKTQHKEFHQIMDSMHGPRCGGFFVEAGANTGVNSVTRAFEQIGWHGLCVEANPHLFHNFLVKNRKDCENIHAALVDGPDQVVFRAYTERLGDLSGIESFRTPKQWAKMEREHANDKRKWTLTRSNVTALSPVWKSKFYGAFVLNHRVVLHAIDATPARWRGGARSSPLDRARTASSCTRRTG